jgi:endonuclease-3
MKVKSEIKRESSRSRGVEKDKVITDIKMEIKSEIKAEIVKLTKGKAKALKEGDSPFPEFSRPSRDDCVSVVESLTAIHGIKEAQNSIRPVLDSLIRTILSQNTTDKTSMIAFQNLKNVCPTWKSTLAASDSVIEEAIRFGGLAEIKTKRIRIILEDILSRHGDKCVKGEPSLEWMRALPTNEVKAELSAYKGVGPKTISCVLMFAMERAEFPVDTHVWHITKKLGWVPPSCSRETCYEHLNSRVPDEFKFALHVLLVDHGKQCKACSKGGGKSAKGEDVPCPLRKATSSSSFAKTLSPQALDGIKQNQIDSINKIKMEYRIDDKDASIKAEPGHHEKISMGLFPSDSKRESSSSSSASIEKKIKKESKSSKITDEEKKIVKNENKSVEIKEDKAEKVVVTGKRMYTYIYIDTYMYVFIFRYRHTYVGICICV